GSNLRGELIINKHFISSFVFALLGVVLIFVGFAKGRALAIQFSKPPNTQAWITSNGLMNAFTYTPVALGITLLILSLIIFTITFWFENKDGGGA
ncbi:hypothetical protein FHS19_006994, partial [Paenibacillus rhizosphaerae]